MQTGRRGRRPLQSKKGCILYKKAYSIQPLSLLFIVRSLPCHYLHCGFKTVNGGGHYTACIACTLAAGIEIFHAQGNHICVSCNANRGACTGFRCGEHCTLSPKHFIFREKFCKPPSSISVTNLGNTSRSSVALQPSA